MEGFQARGEVCGPWVTSERRDSGQMLVCQSWEHQKVSVRGNNALFIDDFSAFTEHLQILPNYHVCWFVSHICTVSIEPFWLLLFGQNRVVYTRQWIWGQLKNESMIRKKLSFFFVHTEMKEKCFTIFKKQESIYRTWNRFITISVKKQQNLCTFIARTDEPSTQHISAQRKKKNQIVKVNRNMFGLHCLTVGQRHGCWPHTHTHTQK